MYLMYMICFIQIIRKISVVVIMNKKLNLSEFREYKLVKEDVIEGKEPSYDFPKYTTQIINQANQNNQATRPKVVGQMSELIQQCPYNSYEGWKKWYLERYPDAIENATDKAYEGVKNIREASKLIDREMVREWITDLVLTKTAEGLIYQEAILEHIATIEHTTYRLASPEEESKGIDGFIGNKAVQVKSITYTVKRALPEDIPCEIIYYDKGSRGSKYLKIYYKKQNQTKLI